jgi:hypothetical protein
LTSAIAGDGGKANLGDGRVISHPTPSEGDFNMPNDTGATGALTTVFEIEVILTHFKK